MKNLLRVIGATAGTIMVVVTFALILPWVGAFLEWVWGDFGTPVEAWKHYHHWVEGITGQDLWPGGPVEDIR